MLTYSHTGYRTTIFPVLETVSDFISEANDIFNSDLDLPEAVDLIVIMMEEYNVTFKMAHVKSYVDGVEVTPKEKLEQDLDWLGMTGYPQTFEEVINKHFSFDKSNLI